MRISCCIWALSGVETEILRKVHELGFSWIDIQPGHLATLESRLLARELGLRVSCLGASFGMAAGVCLDSADAAARQAAVDHVERAVIHAADVGADTVYVVPGRDQSGEGLERYAGSLAYLADAALGRGVRLAIEHFPGRALPTAAETLEFIRRVNHGNLYLLIDTGHLQMSAEDAETTIVNAGDRLAYIHFDDNDGIDDLHLSLLDGVMTEESLAASVRALAQIGYGGGLSLELSPGLKYPAQALGESHDILLRALHLTQWGGV